MRASLALALAIAVTTGPVATAKTAAFKIAGGQTVRCEVTEAGPLSARHGPYEMTTAGFSFGPDASGQHLALVFGFDLSVARRTKPTRIRVEDVTGEKAILLVDDQAPQTDRGFWSANAAPITVSRDSVPWLFETGPTTKVFRVTISAAKKADIVLYQPSIYAAATKAALVESLARLP